MKRVLKVGSESLPACYFTVNPMFNALQMKTSLLTESTKMIEYISNDPVASKVAAGLTVCIATYIVTLLAKRRRNKADNDKIYNFLQQSALQGKHTFRSTHVIAAETKLTEQRVADLCITHDKIERNRKELQSWRLK